MAVRRVWVEAWQMQCCGQPFAIGQTVAWTLSTDVDREYLGTVVGDESAAGITDYEDHHRVSKGHVAATQGKIRSIDAVMCRFARQGASLLPIFGTSVIEQRSVANGWEQESELSPFLGYLVELQTAD